MIIKVWPHDEFVMKSCRSKLRGLVTGETCVWVTDSWTMNVSTRTKLISLQSEFRVLCYSHIYLAIIEVLREHLSRQNKHTVCPERASVFWENMNLMRALLSCSSFSVISQHAQWVEPVHLLKHHHAWLIQQKAQLFVGRCLFWVSYFLFDCQNIFTCHSFFFFFDWLPEELQIQRNRW